MLHLPQKQSLGQGLAHGHLLGPDPREQKQGAGRTQLKWRQSQYKVHYYCHRCGQLGFNLAWAFWGAMWNMFQNGLPTVRKGSIASPASFTLLHVWVSYCMLETSQMCGAAEARCCRITSRLLKQWLEKDMGWGRRGSKNVQCNYYFFFLLRMFIAALFSIAPNWNRSKSPPTGE